MSAPLKSAASAVTRSYPRGLPILVAGTSVVVVGAYVKSQLSTQSNTMDRFFSTYNTPESEASRQRTFHGHPDTRSNMLNILGRK
ncbi:hypothetical protein ACQRIT_007943 [Beauveria bassiana]|uniref:Uncharacterized protein n=3 Tax=Beauveria bassiana TaxID=176275 RepID=A0A2N6NAY5_BEABA|nr:uncharacterized protein BBA_08804 [Beauveria bassiana ARSEF 2860]KAF1733675.1 hypothetical protein CRV24_005203 [Beauveria bassiana]KGQ06567.1 hypothetical protein BBAD15_g8119 [Beauveria bassiana D1-5]EJP62262.1 hypothetical protein BBA_08804 [Beauveria bassiana ARSEF 2860]KAH8709866.1 hypothetical protein HC256_009773 [Beauveria bassiana]PMB64409.1 hypothetical protein BM221_009797 [Beauveria bassiana]